MTRPIPRLIRLLGVLLALTAPAAAVAAQEDAAAIGGAGEIELSVVDFGVGGLVRAGDWSAIRVQATDRGGSQREVILRVAIRDADGDSTQYDRVVSANPGIPQTFWLYAWIPFGGLDATLEVQAFEALEPSGAGRGQLAYRAGRLLGAVSVFNPAIQDPRLGFMGVVGSRQLGLEGYAQSVGSAISRPKGHELFRIGSGLTTASLPDRWHGLVPFDTIVWGSATLREHDPSTLTPERARALRAWIQRGGHLVIVLPPADDPWYRGSHPLASVLPGVRVRRRDGADLESIRPLLTESPDIPLPSNATMHTFEIPDDPPAPPDDPLADASSARPIPVLRTPDGETVVVRRLIGAGAVTVVGIDLGNGDLRRLGLPDTEPLWHRILGMRGATPRLDELSDQERADAGSRTALRFDTTISGAIAKTGRAIQGVFFGLVVFALYWVVAGPGGFALIKWRKRSHHAWLAFVGVIALFTGVSWLGATALRPERVSITHLTLHETVHGQDFARARSWMSVMLPGYGRSEVALARREDAVGSQPSGVLAPWEPSTTIGSLVTGFPDNTGYRIEARRPDSIVVPTRATVKQFRADWGGAPVLGGIRPEETIRVENTRVLGSLTHAFPAPLTDVRIMVVYRQTPILRPGVPLGNGLVARATIWSPTLPGGGWAPGAPLDLEAATTATTRDMGAARGFLRDAVRDGINPLANLGGSGGSLSDRVLAARLLSQLEPPNYSTQNVGVGDRLATRHQTHGWDLGRWFTTPCIIVTGVMQTRAGADALPLPLRVDGNAPISEGTTLVSWVYPLDPSPPGYPWIAPAPVETGGEGESP